MDSKRTCFITMSALLLCFKLSESKGLCQFAQMFPLKGSESCFQKKETNKEEPVNVITTCPRNMVEGNCSCQAACEDPSRKINCGVKCKESETCTCADGFLKKGNQCIRASECGCYIGDIDSVVPNNGTYINSNCTVFCTCNNNKLSCKFDYECSPNASCRVKDGKGQCNCNKDFEGDGEACNALYTDCYDVYRAGAKDDGIYTIVPLGWPDTPINVSCDMTNAGGGWTIFQRRIDGITHFTRKWDSYKHGFGSLYKGKDFWLGNEQIFFLTNQKKYKLRIDIIDSDGTPHYAEYSSFRIDNETTMYKIADIGNHTGDTGNGMDDMIGAVFSTYDQDNDGCFHHNCAKRHGSGWWHNPNYNNYCNECYPSSTCRRFKFNATCYGICTLSNLNGVYNGKKGKNINWNYSNFCNPTSVEMKIRPVT